MRRRLILGGLAAMGALACGGSGTPSDNNPPGDVQVGNNFFTPTQFTVATGGTVTWAWNPGGVVHNVTFNDGEHSSNQSSGIFERTFTAAGTYPYHCTIHGAAVMSGTITVGTPEAGTGGGGGGGGRGGGAYKAGYGGGQ